MELHKTESVCMLHLRQSRLAMRAACGLTASRRKRVAPVFVGPLCLRYTNSDGTESEETELTWNSSAESASWPRSNVR